MVRAANTGVSGATDPRGVVLARTRMMEDTALVVQVPPGSPSLYARFGAFLDAVLGIAALAAAAVLVFSRRGKILSQA